MFRNRKQEKKVFAVLPLFIFISLFSNQKKQQTKNINFKKKHKMSSSTDDNGNCLMDPSTIKAPPLYYWTTIILMSTLFGLMNLAIHLSWLSQFRGLVGRNGISPFEQLGYRRRGAATTMKGLFRPPLAANDHVDDIDEKGKKTKNQTWWVRILYYPFHHLFRLYPSDENMRRVILVGILFGMIQTLVGLLQLIFGCRRDFLSYSTPSICVESTLVRDFILGGGGNNDGNSLITKILLVVSAGNDEKQNQPFLFLPVFIKFLVTSLTSTFTSSWFCSLVCFVTYFSLRETSDRFMGLQMHAKVLELNFWFALLSFCDNSFATVIAFQFFTVRLMVGGGLGKYTGGDSSWNPSVCTAMCYHYWTMPLPNPLSRFFHHLPFYVHKMEVYMTIFVEGPIGFFSLVQPFFNDHWLLHLHVLRLIAFFGNAILLFGINISGNFGHLWLASIAAASASLDDAHLSWIFPRVPLLITDEVSSSSFGNHINNNTSLVSSLLWILHWSRWILGFSICGFYCALQVFPFQQTYKRPIPPQIPFHYLAEKVVIPFFFRNNPLSSFLRSSSLWFKMWENIEYYYEEIFSPLSLCNMYVKFASMTKFRHEVVIQMKPRETGSQWVDVPFKYKPWNENLKPKFAPICHMPSLDWFLWFIPLQVARGGSRIVVPDWFERFLYRLKDLEPCVLDLLDREMIEVLRREGKWNFSSSKTKTLVKNNSNKKEKEDSSNDYEEQQQQDDDGKPVCVRAMIYEFVYSTISDVDDATGVPKGSELCGITQKMEGFNFRVGKPKQGNWWRKTQIGYGSICEV